MAWARIAAKACQERLDISFKSNRWGGLGMAATAEQQHEYK
jgi:hypothetical protein